MRLICMRLWTLIALLTLALLSSCSDDNDQRSLAEYIEENASLELADLVACAGGREEGLLGAASEPTDVFFYPIEGATDFRYFEAENVADSIDFTKYIEKDLDSEPVFNGYLHKFNNIPFTGERMGIVSYRTPGNLHICTAIRQKTNLKPTEVNDNLLEVQENNLTPSFTWDEGLIQENVIYFQVVSDSENNFISGTYTVDKEFTFYDLDNVVFNITDTLASPTLRPNESYTFTLMGISEDNWINVFMEKDFVTN